MSETEIPTETNYVPMADSFAAEEPKPESNVIYLADYKLLH
jgi:hypothetical protein